MASGERTAENSGLRSDDVISALLKSYEEMEMPIPRYLRVVLIPSAILFVATVGLVIGFSFPIIISIPIVLLGFLILATAVLFPKIQHQNQRTEIENRFHLLITHMTVLSTTNINRMEVFRELAEEPEYGALSDEVGRIVTLVDVWNQSLDDACRRRARQVPSRILSDFLDRLAYSMGAGQDLSDFLLREQNVIINKYSTIYEGALDNLEVMKDLYLSMILSMTFALVFAIVLPILTGTDPTIAVAAVIVMYIFVQTGFYLAIRSMTPYDPVWYNPNELETEVEKRLNVSLAIAVVLFFVLLGLLAGEEFSQLPISLSDLNPFSDSIPFALYIAIPLTPLVIPGILYRNEESRIKGRDEEFPSFIRALGASESAKQTTTGRVLKSLRRKDFGSLSPAIDNLYKRLNMRIENRKAWEHFSAETRSYLIQKFAEMYLVGRRMGGDPKQLGELISENMSQVIQLRERRNQATITLVGLLYGITAASTFAFFIGLAVIEILSGMTVNIEASEIGINQLLHTNVYDLLELQYFLVLVILFNAILSSLMIRTVDGGHKANAYLHLVALVWLGAIGAIVTQFVVSSFLVI